MEATGISRELVKRIEKLVGARLESFTPVAGGYTPALRLLCRTSSASFFAKIGATPLTCQFLRREIGIYNQVGADFMPKVIAWEDDDTTPILVLEDLSAAHWPPPWNEQSIELVLAQIETMHATGILLDTYAMVHGQRDSNWGVVAADPAPFLSLEVVDANWLDQALPILQSQEARCSTQGAALCHLDIRSDNICLAGRGAVFVDWNMACLSNPRLDLGSWLPSLAYEGGPLPEKILPDAPEVAAWISGFFAARAGLPNIPDAPYVRRVQREQLQTALPWAIRALDLPPVGLKTV